MCFIVINCSFVLYGCLHLFYCILFYCQLNLSEDYCTDLQPCFRVYGKGWTSSAMEPAGRHLGTPGQNKCNSQDGWEEIEMGRDKQDEVGEYKSYQV